MIHTSEDSLAFESYCYAWYENNTHRYFDASYYDPRCICLAAIEADTDIAGPGVIAGFCVTAVATLAVAWYPALYELLQCYRLGQNPLLILDHRSLLRPFPYSHSVAAARRLLDAFCDLQIITGTAIIIAGLVNVQTISLYHGNLIINYYSLCLYSFWAGRPSYLLEETNLNAFRLLLRRFTIFVSVVLSATFQGIIYRREDLEWDPLDGKRCYVCHDRSADVTRWFWLFGYCIYGTALISTLHNRTMKYVRAVTDFEEYTLRFLWERIFASRRSKTATYRAVKPRSLGNMIRCHLSNPKSIAIQSISLIIFFLYFTVLQFLAIFSYGTGFYALENSVYTAFAAWTLYNILDFKISNRNLLVPPQADGKLEMSWGFGQVLPVVLLLVLIYQILDIRREFKEKSAEYQRYLVSKSCEEGLSYHG